MLQADKELCVREWADKELCIREWADSQRAVCKGVGRQLCVREWADKELCVREFDCVAGGGHLSGVLLPHHSRLCGQHLAHSQRARQGCSGAHGKFCKLAAPHIAHTSPHIAHTHSWAHIHTLMRTHTHTHTVKVGYDLFLLLCERRVLPSSYCVTGAEWHYINSSRVP